MAGLLRVEDKEGNAVFGSISGYEQDTYKDGKVEIRNHFGNWQITKENPIVKTDYVVPTYNIEKDTFQLTKEEEIDGENIVKIWDIELHSEKYVIKYCGTI